MKPGKPPSTLQSLLRAHRAQRYPGDLGASIASASPRYWRIAGIAALLALAASLGWLLAPADDPPVAERSTPKTPAEPPPRLDTLELPINPSDPAPDAAVQRRPVLPGLLTANRAAARPPRFPASLRAPAMPSPPRIFSANNTQTHVPQEPLP